jgi:hypothetical protein
LSITEGFFRVNPDAEVSLKKPRNACLRIWGYINAYRAPQDDIFIPSVCTSSSPKAIMKTIISSCVALALTGYAAAYPSILAHLQEQAGSGSVLKRQLPPSFNAALQYVSNTGSHAFVAPGPNDQRGPCPGLNAAANQ